MSTSLEQPRHHFPQGEHCCLLHESEAERLCAVVPFLHDGLQADERCLYLAREGKDEAAMSALADAGVEVNVELARGAIALLDAGATYLQGGRFDPERMIRFFCEEAARAEADGFSGLRVTSDMAWALGAKEGCERVLEFEAVIGEVLRECGVTSLCQYDRGLFPAARQHAALRTHQTVVIDNDVCKNLYDEPARFLLGEADEEDRVEWMLGQLRAVCTAQRQRETAMAERDRSVAELEGQRIRLSQILQQMPAGVVIADASEHVISLHNQKADEIASGPWSASVSELLGRSLRGQALTGEELEINENGQVRTLQCNAAPLRDADGAVVAGMVAFLDVTESRRAASECKRLLDEARRSDNGKDEFLAMLGHELRNPLGAISNGLQVLRRKGKGRDAATQHDRELIERQVRHMARLLDDLLDVSRITRGLTSLDKERVDLASVIARAVANTSPLVQLRRHQLSLSLPPGPLPVEGDATRLEQIISNLLSNAARYTEPGGSIWLSLRREEGQAVIRVRDSGAGISAELLPRIFDMFTQGERPLDRSQGGLGVGLTLARRLAELHGGSIEAASDGAGRGSEFIVRLPALVELSGLEVAKEESPPAELSTDNAPRVLLVEDNVDAAAMLYELLVLLGYRVHVAHDGPSALELADQHRPDVVLLDIGLPGMDGYEVAQQLRKDARNQGLLIVALTGYGQESDRRRSREAGFDHHLVKPVDVDELDKVIAMGCERNHEAAASVG